MNKAEIIFDAITGIREELIDGAQDYRFQKQRRAWGRYAALAACLALALWAGWSGLTGGGGTSGSNAAMPPQSAETCPREGDTGSDKTPEQSENSSGGTNPADGAAVHSFTATVLEVRDGYLLLEPAEGESIRSSADRIEASTGGVGDLPELEAGDRVVVTYTGGVQETYPAQVTEVTGIQLLE